MHANETRYLEMLAAPPLVSRAAWRALFAWHPEVDVDEREGDGAAYFADALRASVLAARRRAARAAAPDAEVARWVRSQAWWW